MAKVARNLPNTLRDTARMRVFASSRTVGRPGRFIEAATDLWFGNVREDQNTGGTLVTARVPTLGDAAPLVFQQGVLFDDGLRREDTVFDLLGDMIHDVESREENSSRFDAALLRHLPRVLADGIEGISIKSPRYHDSSMVFDRSVTKAAEDLASQAPPAARTRVVGVLESLSFSDRAFVLVVGNGNRLRGQWKPDDPEPLRSFWGHRVLLEGIVEFKITGTPLSIVAEAIRSATASDEFWSVMPRSQQQERHRPRLLVKGRNPLAALVGLGAQEGTDEEFIRALEAIR